jgi:hypothetical protein
MAGAARERNTAHTQKHNGTTKIRTTASETATSAVLTLKVFN